MKRYLSKHYYHLHQPFMPSENHVILPRATLIAFPTVVTLPVLRSFYTLLCLIFLSIRYRLMDQNKIVALTVIFFLSRRYHIRVRFRWSSSTVCRDKQCALRCHWNRLKPTTSRFESEFSYHHEFLDKHFSIT